MVKTFSGPYSVKMTVKRDYEVTFAVENSYEWKVRTPKETLAITRWLLTTWKTEVLPLSSYFYCVPCNGDMNGEGGAYRRKIYAKMGFTCLGSRHMQYGLRPIEYNCTQEYDDKDFPYWKVANENISMGFALAEPIDILLILDGTCSVQYDYMGYAKAVPMIKLIDETEEYLYPFLSSDGYAGWIVVDTDETLGWAESVLLP